MELVEVNPAADQLTEIKDLKFLNISCHFMGIPLDNVLELIIYFRNTYNLPGVESKTVLTMDPQDGKKLIKRILQ